MVSFLPSFLPSFLRDSFLLSFLHSFLPWFLPFFLPSCLSSSLLPSFLPAFLPRFRPPSFLPCMLPTFLPSSSFLFLPLQQILQEIAHPCPQTFAVLLSICWVSTLSTWKEGATQLYQAEARKTFIAVTCLLAFLLRRSRAKVGFLMHAEHYP